MTSYTPGPWLWGGSFLYPYNGPFILRTSVAPHQTNARLIAAAPDLLEAAQAALAWMPDGAAQFHRLLEAYNKSEGGEPEVYALDDWKERKSAVIKQLWEATRAAIAAAEGVQP